MAELTLHEHRIAYDWRGSGGGAPAPGRPTLVFLHDGLGAMAAWKDVPARLAGALGANRLAYDRRGYGASEARDAFPGDFLEAEAAALGALLGRLGIARPHLIGHSDGGSIALLYAAAHPGAVASVVTVAAHTFVEPETRAGIEALAAAQREGRTPAWLRRLHGERAEALLTAWSARWLSERHARWDVRGVLGRVRCPALAIQGERDAFGTPAQVAAIADGVAGAETWLVPGCGHTPHHEAGDAFVARVAVFLRAHGGGDAG